MVSSSVWGERVDSYMCDSRQDLASTEISTDILVGLGYREVGVVHEFKDMFRLPHGGRE